MNFKRRLMLKISLATGLVIATFPWLGSRPTLAKQNSSDLAPVKSGFNPVPLGADDDGLSRVFLAKNGTPEQNLQKTIEMMGGIDKFIGPRDIVVLKPNAQWWNQGMTNTDTMQGFIDMVLAISGFSGEILIAENHQYKGDDSRGWNTTERNGRFNYNELVDFYQRSGHPNVNKYHWHVAGTFTETVEGDAQGDSRVTGPEGGDGYVWMDDCYYLSPSGDKCLMTYPIFTSPFSGITVDLKNGPWKNGVYLQDRKVRFINFSVLNHHGHYCGVTASVKNLMGVVDMTCGFPGDKPAGTYNVHHIGVSKKILWTKKKLHWRLEKYKYKFEEFCTRNFHYTGGALGVFMKEVRMPDLNIITAERVGWGHRTKLDKSSQTRTVLAGRDPVALDYLAAREVLLPVTPPEQKRPGSGVRYHDLNNPDITDGPFRRFLAETHRQGVGNLNPTKIVLISHDFNNESRPQGS